MLRIIASVYVILVDWVRVGYVLAVIEITAYVLHRLLHCAAQSIVASTRFSYRTYWWSSSPLVILFTRTLNRFFAVISGTVIFKAFQWGALSLQESSQVWDRVDLWARIFLQKLRVRLSIDMAYDLSLRLCWLIKASLDSAWSLVLDLTMVLEERGDDPSVNSQRFRIGSFRRLT